jgi:hypothetical protein
MTDAPVRRSPLRMTLLVGGGLLLASAVLTFARTSLLSSPLWTVVSWGGIITYSAAVLVYAFGLGRAGSIVARRPLALTAAVVMSLWPFAERVLTFAIPYGDDSAGFYEVWGYVSIVATLGAAIVFVVQIARAGVIDGAVRWMPLWALVGVAAPQLLAQAIVVASGIDVGRTDADGIFAIWGIGMLFAFAAPVTLGVLSLVRASRPDPVERRDRAVQVYPPEQ